jgi:hypothetical protein
MAITSATAAETIHGAFQDTMLLTKLDMSMPTIVLLSIPEPTITFKPLMLTSTSIGATFSKYLFLPNHNQPRARSVLEIRYLLEWLNAVTFSVYLA